ncbi:M23 family metallopeptidase [Thalassorhabdus alkalitolerans]|uniref:M23 family metallopeptidase n=1 Tax=Thalassorhabdus alkalitolerans TaxID=2282697 RepID=A0ABW0YKB2_9BACI
MKRFFLIFISAIIICLSLPLHQGIAAEEMSADDIYKGRMTLYKQMEAVTYVPWYWLAAVDAYERGIRRARKDREETEGLISIFYAPKEWAGPLNPDWEDEDPYSLALFEGIGLDGDQDGKASRVNDMDILFTFASYLASYGHDDDNIEIGLWDYYQRDQAVNIIKGHADLYKKHQKLDLDDRVFPVPLNYNYSYRSTWGDRRGWGGRRIHEGTDIFAGYNTPVRSTTYGVVELKGWNRFGGWRIGIRDNNNVYHYYAHLSGFEKDIKKGTLVEPGTVIGYVGSSGYGKPGTQGKFPPHLHYGMYRDNGYTEWSFDPYPNLRSWEKQERRKK